MNLEPVTRWTPVIVLATCMIAAFAAGLHDGISLQRLQDNKEIMLATVTKYPVLSALGFITTYSAVVALSLPVAALLTLAGGFLFGPWLGIFYVVLAATSGATIIFYIARTSFGAALQAKAGGLYRRIEGNMNENAPGYLPFMRLMPILDRQMKAHKGNLTILLGSFFLAVTVLTPRPVYADSRYNEFLNLYDGLLQDYVHPVRLHKSGIDYNGVNYDSWAADIRYYKAKQLLTSIDPDLFGGRRDQMTFWINAYNFMTVDLIARKNEQKSIKNLGSLFSSPWTTHHWSLGNGKDYTLDEIEHKILRPLGDARIHFAINCASISCPDLRNESYRPEKLYRQLEEQVRLTLANINKGLRVENGTLYVSRIFDWFHKDFNDGNLKDWLARYRSVDRNLPIKFMNYNWALNKAN